MRKSKLFIFISILTIIFLSGTAALLGQCSNPNRLKVDEESKEELQEGKQQETNRIVAAYRAFEAGKNVTWVIPPDRMKDRLDVKHCIGDRGRKRGVWLSAGYDVVRLKKDILIYSKMNIISTYN